MKTIKILFVEDHEMVRNGIKFMLKSQNSFTPIIDEAKDGIEAMDMVIKNKYDVILLDINLPNKDGISITKHLITKHKDVRILVLTSHKEDYVIKNVIEAGAHGYILKDSGIEELTKAIITVYTHKKYFSNEVSQVLLNKQLPNHKPEIITPNTLISNLSTRELEVLKHIANGYTNVEIGEKLNISPRTAGNHRNNLLQKLNIKNSIGLATYAVKNGII